MVKALYGAAEDEEATSRMAWRGELNPKQTDDGIHAGGQQPQPDWDRWRPTSGEGEGRVHQQDTGCIWHWPNNGRDTFLFFSFFFSFFWPSRVACGILVPRLGIEPGPSVVKAPSLNHWTAREFPRRHVS